MDPNEDEYEYELDWDDYDEKKYDAYDAELREREREYWSDQFSAYDLRNNF